MRGLAVLIAILMNAEAVAAPKPPPKSEPFEPEIGYVYATYNSMELRLANERGTTFITMLRGAPGSIGQFDLSPRSRRQIAYAEDGVLKLMTYGPLATWTFLAFATETIWSGPGRVVTMDFSRDGSKLAFYVDTGKIMVHDFATGTSKVFASVENVRNLAWYHDGSALVFHAPVPGGVTDGIYELDAAGGTPVLLLQEAVIFDVDTARTDKTLLVNHNRVHKRHGKRNAGRPVVDFWRGGAYVRESHFFGTLAHFNCDDRKMIYRSSLWKNRPTFVVTLKSAHRTFPPEDGITNFDWIPTCAGS